MAQLEETIKLGYGRNEVPFQIPINEYLASSMKKGLEAIRNGYLDSSKESLGLFEENKD
jgi:hypothetical protein